MNSQTLKLLCTASLSLFALGACAGPQALISADANAVNANIAAQAITPPAEQKANTHIPADVTLRDAARERYRSGKVTVPNPQSTQ